MMESAGGIVQAVTMLLLQQQDGAVRVFPALPGDKEDILPKAVQYHEDDFVLEGVYGRWENVNFDGLLAPGGFRIDAERRDGRIVFLKIKSERKETLHLWLPAEFSENGEEMLFEKDMEAGEVLCWGKHEKELLTESVESSGVSVHKAARTHRRIMIGADRHTAFRKAVDGFTCAYGWGNELRYCQTPYVFDFGNIDLEKNYDDAYDRQIVMSGRCILYTADQNRSDGWNIPRISVTDLL